jgi:hypothetical protein
VSGASVGGVKAVVSDPVHGRVPRVLRMCDAERKEREHELAGGWVTKHFEDHPPAAVGGRQVGLQAAGQAGPVTSLRVAALELERVGTFGLEAVTGGVGDLACRLVWRAPGPR